jgi:DnaJ like chaperone protein
MWKSLFIIAAVLYSLYPTDFIPDWPIPGLGLLDDIAVLIILWQIYVRLKQRLGNFQGDSTTGNGSRNEKEKNDTHSASTPRSPYEILGVSQHATQDEIKQAYRLLAGKYHPDKVSHLGEEFRAMAENRFKEIQAAYQELTRTEK